jgi:hypothetical protein
MMARSRRGRSRGPELRGTLGTLLRTTLAQAGAVKDVLQRGAREGRARLDEARSTRRRDQALAELGELVVELIDRGEAPELEDHPDVQAALEAIAELDAVADDGGDRARGRPVAGRDFVTPSRRAPFDRGSARSRDARDDDDDGAVSSRSWRPPPPGGDARVWRPPRDRDPAKEPGAAFQEKTRPGKPPTARGGIAFDADPDDDLEAYMHPDDVKPPDPKDKK